ncbi:diamine N-acetyltransferase, partial [Mycena capillaripes]
ATCEKEPDSVKNTLEFLRKNLFSPTPYAHALLAFSSAQSEEEGPGPSGWRCTFSITYSTWTGRPGMFLEDLCVSPESRGQGLGKALFGVSQGRRCECARLDWSVLKWNHPSIAFYEHTLSATQMREWVGMRLDEGGIEQLEQFALPTRSGGRGASSSS